MEIHLQSCDRSGAPALETEGGSTMGDNCGRESGRDYISVSSGSSVGGAGGAQEGTHGVVFREQTHTDRG